MNPVEALVVLVVRTAGGGGGHGNNKESVRTTWGLRTTM